MQHPRFRRFLLLASAALVALTLGACSDEDGDDGNGGETDTGGTTDTGTTSDTGGGQDTGGGEASQFNQDRTWRVTRAEVTRPEGLGEILSGLINNDIAQQKLHVMIDMKDFADPTGDTTFMITGNAGEVTDDPNVYTWHPTIDPADIAYVPATMSASGMFGNTETTVLDFPALVPNSDPPEVFIIPIQNLFITGSIVTADGGLVLTGGLEGAILEEDAQGITIQLSPGADPVPLMNLLSSVDQDYIAEGDTEPSGWVVEGSLFAAPVEFVVE